MTDSPITAALTRVPAGPQSAAQNAAAAAAKREGVRQVAQEFEALFLAEMLAPVFESVDTDGLFGGGESEKIFRSMMVQEYGKAIAQSGGVGIADAVQREILRMQENQQ
jgi:Rod binding domain-containing protein